MRYIDISAELLLGICQQGAQFIAADRAATCTKGVSEKAMVARVEVMRDAVRVFFIDPEQPEGNEPAMWTVTERNPA